MRDLHWIDAVVDPPCVQRIASSSEARHVDLTYLLDMASTTVSYTRPKSVFRTRTIL